VDRIKAWASPLYNRKTLKDDAIAGVVLGRRTASW
jgi:hypothetical protein